MKLKITLSLFISILIIGCKMNNSNKDNQVETNPKISSVLYMGGDIVTMDGNSLEMAEAIVTQDDEIVFVGALAGAEKEFPNSKKHNLKGNTLMPGFVEPHVHPSLAATMLPNEIIAPYDWVLPTGTKKGVSGHDAYIDAITKSITENAKDGEMYFIWGYHQLWHGELSRDMINTITKDKPVGIIHRSFHEIYLNDAAIELLGITENDFKGNSQVEWDKGHFYEGGWLALVPKMAPIMLEPTRYMEGLGMMTQLIQQNGITTVAEPGFPSADFDGEIALLKKEMAKEPPYDVYLIPSGTQLFGMKGGNEEAMAFMETLSDTYNTDNIHFLPKQVKLFSDGAIYSQLMQMKDDYTDGHHGEWMTPLDLFQEQISMYWDNDYKIHVHSNGDKGIQQVLDFLELDQKRNARKNHRFTLHHMGYYTDDMAQEIKELGVEASVNPYYLWALADKYSENGLGKERGENLVRINSLVKRDIPVSFHSDFSMAPMEPLTIAWTAINRVTSEKNSFSQDQKIPVFEAMKAITIDAARTLNLEKQIGSIAEGKRANLVILNESPFSVDPMEIKNIKVLATIFEGGFNIVKSNNLKGGK
ncbi:metal-dependent hydrolase [Winogradskyella sp. PC-19]|uniref:amidohydrolase n=2 Tax=unclassified Winogradskyella TaxID=2615021 RepID=UPI000B3D0A1B|nr:amidohydrolase [Winogradskyella sp. PC-19]ARV10579.1 metal-dependent hydrolase [Winogradskyella sp. PC-19]